MKWHQALGFGADNYRFHDHEKLAFYANAATDIEFKMPFGFKEVEGIHSRTNFDLSNHEKFSGKKIQYFDPELNQSYVPYVIETSIGVDRMFLSVYASSYEEEKLENGETRVRVEDRGHASIVIPTLTSQDRVSTRSRTTPTPRPAAPLTPATA